MKQKSVIIVGSLIAFFLLGSVFAVDNNLYAKEIQLRLAVPAPPGDYPLTYGAQELAKRFNARTKGKYRMEVHAGGALVKIPEFFDAVRIGAVEMAMIDWAIFSFLDPKLALVSSPFLINSLEAGIEASELFLPIHDELLRKKFNAAALGMFSVTGVDLVAKKPVLTLEDWKGLLVGAGSPITAAMFTELGAAPVTIAWTDLYESLQKGVIDATAQVIHGAITTNLFDVCTDLTIFFGLGCFNGITINLDVYNKMPEDIKTILQEEVDTTEAWMRDAFRQLALDDIKTLKEKGIKIHVVSKEERERWIKVLEPFNEKQFKQFGEFGQKVKEVVDQVNAKYPYTEISVE